MAKIDEDRHTVIYVEVKQKNLLVGDVFDIDDVDIIRPVIHDITVCTAYVVNVHNENIDGLMDVVVTIVKADNIHAKSIKWIWR